MFKLVCMYYQHISKPNQYKIYNQYLMQMSPPSLFERMFEGDVSIDSAGNECIVLMGMSRVGKSTLFNWFVRNILRGVRRFAAIQYQTVKGDNDAAAVKGGNESVTLIPNIHTLSNGVTVVDLPGFADSRDHIGVIGVSYMLKAMFKTGKKYKFIIVTSESQFQEGQFLKTLNYFIDMFKLETLQTQMKQQFLNSICLMVTRCVQADYIIDNLNSVQEDINNVTNILPLRRNVLLQIIKHIIDNQKFMHFKIAKENTNAPVCTFFDDMATKKWDYFNYDTDIIELPYKRQYRAMPKEQQQKLQALIKKKLNSFKQLSTIVANFLEHTIANNYQNNTDYSNIFNEVDEFIQNHYEYGSNHDSHPSELGMAHQFSDEQVVPLPTSLKLMINICQLSKQVEKVEDYSTVDGDSWNIMGEAKTTLVNILKIVMKSFCRTRQEQAKIIALAFIVLRGIRQCQMMHQLDETLMNQAINIIKTSIQSIQEQSIQTIKESFIETVTEDSLSFMVTNVQQGEQLHQFIAEFIKQSQKTDNKFDSILIDLKVVKKTGNLSKNLDTKKGFRKALEYFTIVHQRIKEYMKNLNNPEKANENENKMKCINLELIGNYRNIASCLDRLGKSDKALEIVRRIQFVSSACSLFAKIVSREGTIVKRIDILLQFSEYCANWGRIPMAIQLLQDAYELTTDVARSEEIVEKQLCYSQDKSSYDEAFTENLKKPAIIDPQEEEIEELIKHVCKIISVTDAEKEQQMEQTVPT